MASPLSSSDRIVLSPEVLDTTPLHLSCKLYLTIDTYPVLPGSDPDGDGDEDFGVIWVQVEDILLEEAPDSNGQEANNNGEHQFLQYSINPEGESIDSVRSELLWVCDDQIPEILQLRVWDEVGNFSVCSVPLRNIDTRETCGHCHPLTRINGWIRTEKGIGVPAVGATNQQYSQDSITWFDGYYDFCGLDGEPVTISLYKEDNYLEGISVSDLIILREHVLSLDTLNSPYQYLAADVNNDGRISTLDIIELQRLILGLQSSFTVNSSWRFVPEEYTFPDPRNPWSEDFPTAFTFSLTPYGHPGNFIAIKIGDLNGTAPLPINP